MKMAYYKLRVSMANHPGREYKKIRKFPRTVDAKKWANREVVKLATVWNVLQNDVKWDLAVTSPHLTMDYIIAHSEK